MINKYREAMDKIIVSDELKEKLLRKAAESNFSASEPPPRPQKNFLCNFRRGLGYAACLLLCAALVSAGVGLHNTVNNDTETQPLAPSAAPVLTADKDSGQESTTPTDTPPAVSAAKPSVPQKTQRGTADSKEQIEDSEQLQEASVTPFTIDAQLPPNDQTREVRQQGGADSNTSLEDIQTRLGHDFKIPRRLPAGYKPDTAALLRGGTVEISYQSPQGSIVYRTANTQGAESDISSDYTLYPDETTAAINGAAVTLKGSGDSGLWHLAIWSDAESSYSLRSDSGLAKDAIVSIIESVDYEK